MPPATLSIVPNEPAPDRLAGLIAKRGKIAAEVVDINRQRANLSNFENEEAAVHAEIGQFGHGFAEKMAEWAKNPKGEAPMADAAKREELAHKLIAAQTRAIAATEAIAALDARQIELRDEDAKLSQEIEAEIFKRLKMEYDAKCAGLAEAISKTRYLAADVQSLRHVIGEGGRALVNSGAMEAGTELLRRLERLPPAPSIIETSPSDDEIHAAAQAWQARAAALRGGAQ